MVRRSFPGRSALVLVMLPTAVGCGALARNDNAEGVRLYQQGNYQGAVNSFQQALARQPGSPDTFYNIGATYHQQAKLFGRPQDLGLAEQYYRLCLDRKPDHAACQRALAVLLVEENREGEALANLDAWARLRPGDPTPRIEMARLCEEHGDRLQAENHLVDALAIDPNNSRALVALGHLRESSGNPQLAAANYARALAVDGRQPMVAARVAAMSSGVPPGATAAPSGVVAGVPAPMPPVGVSMAPAASPGPAR